MNISRNSTTNVNFGAKLNASMLQNYREYAPEWLETVVKKIKTNNPDILFSADAFSSNAYILKDKDGNTFWHNIIPYVKTTTKSGKEIKKYLKFALDDIRCPISLLQRTEPLFPDEMATALRKIAESPTLSEDVQKAEKCLLQEKDAADLRWKQEVQERIANLNAEMERLKQLIS